MIARPQPSHLPGRSLPFVLFLALPESFEISVELLSSPADLRQIRLLDIPLAEPDAQSTTLDTAANSHSNEDDSPGKWHLIHLSHQPSATNLTIDGHPVPVSRSTPLQSQWLTIEPAPEHEAVLRNLRVTW